MTLAPIIVVEDTFKFNRGTIIETYTHVSNGIVAHSNDFLSKKNFVVLTETLSREDEKRVRDMIRQQIRLLLWNLYTKNSILIGNL